MKKLILATALVAVLLLLVVSVQAAPFVWTQTVNNATLTVARTPVGADWLWTYTLTVTGPSIAPVGQDIWNTFNAQWLIKDDQTVGSGQLYNYQVVSDTQPGLAYQFNEVIMNPSDPTAKSTGIWAWRPDSNTKTFGTKEFSVLTSLGYIGSGDYNLNFTGPYGSMNSYGFKGVASPTTVPEPGTLLAALGLLSPAGMLLRRRRS